MIRLVSKWKLKKGLPQELLHNLATATEHVQSQEACTLRYLIHMEPQTTSEKPAHGSKPSLIPFEKQTDITFIETYSDAEAFDTHFVDSILNNFRKQNLKHFEEDPEQSGWPVNNTHVHNSTPVSSPTDLSTRSSINEYSLIQSLAKLDKPLSQHC